MCLFVSLQKLQDVVFAESPAAVVLRCLPPVLSGAAPRPAHRCPQQQNVSLLFIPAHSDFRLLRQWNKLPDNLFFSIFAYFFSFISTPPPPSVTVGEQRLENVLICETCWQLFSLALAHLCVYLKQRPSL